MREMAIKHATIRTLIQILPLSVRCGAHPPPAAYAQIWGEVVARPHSRWPTNGFGCQSLYFRQHRVRFGLLAWKIESESKHVQSNKLHNKHRRVIVQKK
jgi:hypothetical protein